VNPWPIVITAYFVVFFSGLVAFIVFATTRQVDLVRPDYYEEEVRYQQQLDRVQRTQALPERVSVTYDPARHWITVTLPKAHAQSSSGQIHLYRPSDAKLDQRFPLAPDVAGAQRIDASKLRSGLWNVRVEWVVQEQQYYFNQSVIIPSPHPS